MKQSHLLTALIFICGFSISISHAASSNIFSETLLAQNSSSLNKAAQTIKQQTGGRVISAKTVNKNGRVVHKIKILLPSGKIQIFSVNAN